jgi:energy-coupling factor transport system substrate-specific component
VTWQIATFSLLVLVLVGGVWWYERSRPPARLVAMVAALAALAVAGRLVLAPIPNVVATTDVALLTGYSLGAAPGFAVGALAAPISNIWLGQGPWTAWQAAGWGLVGLAGAWIAIVTARRLGRLGLAVVCALAGFAYGALLDLSVMVTYGGEQSLDRFLALSGRGLPFNVAHAAGNFAIAFAAGPALVRMISRYRTRTEFSWRPAGALPLAMVLLAAALALSAAVPEPARGDAAAGWLERSQNEDGGFAAARGQPSSPAMTGWAMLGLEAAGVNPLDVRRHGNSPVAYLREEVDRIETATDLERTILALVGAGLDPRQFEGRDLVARLGRQHDRDGSVDGQVNITAFSVLAMRAAGADPGGVRRAIGWLRRAQGENGGWGFQPRAPSDPDSTGAALQAIAAAGGGGGTAAAGVRYLRQSQTRSGGFALATSGVVNAQSTAWAVQGLLAADAGGRPVRRALAYLDSVRASDGHFRYSRSSDQTPVWVTSQALLAVSEAPFPLAAVARDPGARGAAEPGGGSGTGAEAPSVAGASGGDPSPASSPVPDDSPGGGAGGGGRGEDEEKSRETRKASGEPAAPAEATRSERRAPEAGSTTASAPEPEDSDSPTAPYVAAGLAGLALALGAGFLWYRRRLP